MKTEIIERKGKSFAVVPLRDYQRLMQDSEMLEDVRAYDAAKGGSEETFPSAVVNRLFGRGESDSRVSGISGSDAASACGGREGVAPVLGRIGFRAETGVRDGASSRCQGAWSGACGYCALGAGTILV